MSSSRINGVSGIFNRILAMVRPHPGRIEEVEIVTDQKGNFEYDRKGNVKTYNPNAFWRNITWPGGS